MTRISTGRAALAVAVMMAMTGLTESRLAPVRAADAKQTLTPDDAVKLGAEAYVYGFPLVLMDITRQVRTAVPKADDRKAPANQFVHSTKFPDHTFTTVVSPNADTLYSSSWLDLSKEPMVLSVPEMGKR